MVRNGRCKSGTGGPVNKNVEGKTEFSVRPVNTCIVRASSDIGSLRFPEQE